MWRNRHLLELLKGSCALNSTNSIKVSNNSYIKHVKYISNFVSSSDGRIVSNNTGNIRKINGIVIHQYSTSQVILSGVEKYTSQEDKEAKEKGKKSRRKRLVLGSILGGVLVGSGYAYLAYNRQEKEKVLGNESGGKEFLLDTPPPTFLPARSIRNPDDRTGLKITLFQYQTCPFCCKARVFLDYFGFNYDVIEVNSVMRQQVKWSKYKKVPIVVVESGDKVIQVNDSSVIVSALYSLLSGSSQALEEVMESYPTMRWMEDGKEKSEIQNKYFLMYHETQVSRSKEDIVEERRWRKWVDDVLVHTLSPNVYRSSGESLEAFSWFSEVGNWEEHFSWWERTLVIYFGSVVMWIIGKRLKKRHNLKDDVRQSLYDECNNWMKALKKKGTPFMGGEQPNLSDLAVFGVLNAIEGCTAFKDARMNTKIGIWFDRMKIMVANRHGKELVSSS